MSAKVFIIHSQSDADFVERLAARLREADAKVWLDCEGGRAGDNVLDRVTRGLEDVQYVLAVISKSFTSTSWIAYELSTWMLREALSSQPVIVPALIEACALPSFLADHEAFDFSDGFEAPAEALVAWIDGGSRQGVASAGAVSRNVAQQIGRLREAFVRGKLTLFCGAGVSISAGIPGWKIFLRALLSDFFDKSGSAVAGEGGRARRLAGIYQEYFDLSPLIVAQYLKNVLGRDFQRTVRDALYISAPTASPMIDAICELCRPQREQRSLHGIVNFNFDDLIEHSLERNKIKHKAIFAEGQRPAPAELPIFHVHGYLPRDHNPGSEIVFSEDAYHSKFIDPFSWSNLTQLNQLNQNTCLFVGLGMTDPNLRRLLDVSMRKNPEKSMEHFVFKRRYDVDDLALHMTRLEAMDQAEDQARKMVRMAEILEERDCNNLGLNVIWVDEFDDMPPLIARIAEG